MESGLWCLSPFSPIWSPSKSLLKYHTFSLWHLLILGLSASRPIFTNLEPFQILIEISHILFITFANSGPQCLPAHFIQSGAPPNPYWNMPHSLYHIWRFWASVPPGSFSSIWSPSKSLLKYATFSLSHLTILGLSARRPIFVNLEPLQILTEICHILFMTFANSGPQCLPAHFPLSGFPPKPMNIVSDWFRFLTRPISKRFDFVIRFVTRLIKKTPRFSGCFWSNWSNKTFWVFG